MTSFLRNRDKWIRDFEYLTTLKLSSNASMITVATTIFSTTKQRWTLKLLTKRSRTLSRSSSNHVRTAYEATVIHWYFLLSWYTHLGARNSEKYCQGGVEILHRVRPQELLRRAADDNLPLAACSRPTIPITRVRKIRPGWQWSSRQVEYLSIPKGMIIA